MKRVSSRAIIVKDGKLVVLFRRRIRDGKKIEYYSLPGGGLEENETLEENVIREVKEELNIDIKILGYVGKAEDEKTIQHFFHAEIIKGTPVLGGEELDRLSDDNYYEVSYLDIDSLEKNNINYIDIIKDALSNKYISLN